MAGVQSPSDLKFYHGKKRDVINWAPLGEAI